VIKIRLEPFWIRLALCGFRWLMWRFDHRRPASKRRSNGRLIYEFQRFVDPTKTLACLLIGFGRLFLKPCSAMSRQWIDPVFESIVKGIYLSPISHLMNPRVALINESILRTSIRVICIPF